MAIVGCGGHEEPADEVVDEGALEATTPAGEREVACSFSADGISRRLLLSVAPEGRSTRGAIWLNQRVANPPEARGFVDDLFGFVRGTARPVDGRLVVSVEAAFEGGEASVPRRFALALPLDLVNEPGRAATDRGLAVPAPTWFDADVVSSDVRMSRPRCEQTLAPTAPGYSGRVWLAGADAERLFDAMDVPLESSETRGTAGYQIAAPQPPPRPGVRPVGTKSIRGSGHYYVSCTHRDGEADGIAVEASSGPAVTCFISVLPIVVARTESLRTYRATLTEREKAGRLFVAFAAQRQGAGVGFETGPFTATVDRRQQLVPGSGARLECVAVDDVRTTCVLEVRTPWSP